MPVYAYKGVSSAGKTQRGHVDAESARAARAQLKQLQDAFTEKQHIHGLIKFSGGQGGIQRCAGQAIAVGSVAYNHQLAFFHLSVFR